MIKKYFFNYFQLQILYIKHINKYPNKNKYNNKIFKINIRKYKILKWLKIN